ncbi:hypothetical protein [Nocardia bovistercoris]|uniref:DUF4304 domain-containing protein n=1 Tax=Nocardia bovistercoris TaxID=2785916 RepID=A0A931N3P0_9NOCA|nr:hypothetical protein [Nocardia bovistercoris]MBH0776753.1 hypothetical protein [Nocardia bovistercoris]
MVSSDTALRRLFRDTGKLLEPYGFHGAEPVWTHPRPGGLARIGRTRITRTWTDGQQVISFGLTLSATPGAWREFRDWRNARNGLPPVPEDEAAGPDLIDAHRLPKPLTIPWTLRTDPDRPGHALQADLDAIRAELPARLHAYARRALRLLEPDEYLDEVLAHPEPDARVWEVAVVLLTDHGPGPRLDDAVNRLRRGVADGRASEFARDILVYARDRATNRAPTALGG